MIPRPSVTRCIFGRDSLFPRTTNVSGIEQSQCQYVLLLWWSGTVATVLWLFKTVVRKYISPRINFCPYAILPAVSAFHIHTPLLASKMCSHRQNFQCSFRNLKTYKHIGPPLLLTATYTVRTSQMQAYYMKTLCLCNCHCNCRSLVHTFSSTSHEHSLLPRPT